MKRKFSNFPVSKVRSLLQKDEDYKLVQKDALLLIARASELLIQDLAGVCGQIAKMQKRKTI